MNLDGGTSMKFILAPLLLLAFSAAAEDEIVKTISHGETVELEKHRAAGKYLVVEFYADW